MLQEIFKGIFDSSVSDTVTLKNFLICVFSSLLLGLFIAIVYTYRNRYTGSFLLTLALIPCVVCVVIMMVNGNIGAGVAVAGAFSLVRFRSAPGSAKEIANIFLAMGAGLICGMGYIAYAVLFTVILCLVMLILQLIGFGKRGGSRKERTLKITIPEDLNYTDVFDGIFEKYTSYHMLTSVKTSNMGSLFKLKYNISLKDPSKEKEMIDALRIRNGNLEISMSLLENTSDEL